MEEEERERKRERRRERKGNGGTPPIANSMIRCMVGTPFPLLMFKNAKMHYIAGFCN